jgi:competence protein ComEC
MRREPLDLRLAPVALASWSGSALGIGWTVTQAMSAAGVLLGAGAVLLWKPAGTSSATARLAAAAVLVAAGAVAIAGLRAGAVSAGPLPALASQQSYVKLSAFVTSDPVRRESTFAPYVVVRVEVRSLTSSGMSAELRSPALVIGPEPWLEAHFGDSVEADGHLQASRSPDLAGVLIARGPPVITKTAGPISGGIAAVRHALVEAAAGLPEAQRALVPALVDGDDSAMPAEVSDDFRTTGLTHLLAVSGSNLTLVLAFALFVARWCGVRAVGLTLTGLLTVIFFVLLARPEPSVLRAAAMGVVGLTGLSVGGRRRGVRALAVAVTVLVLYDPWLARSVGFLLSSLATAGILVLAPIWRDAMARWMPRVAAEAVAVPLAAQIVCTPAIAAISGQVSLVAVVANLAAAPAVGPTTVLGLIAGLVTVVSAPVGHVLGHLAGLPAGWIILVATRGARLAGASVTWPVSFTAIAVLVVLCVAQVTTLHLLLRRRFASLAVAVLLVAVVLRPLGRLGWPPSGWLLVACDVGQGDGLVLNAGSGAAVVVDTGPDPRLMDHCLDRLHVHYVPLVVLTHFHADHADGLPGVLHGRQVGEIETSPLPDPPDRAAAVTAEAAAASVDVSIAVAGEERTLGQLHWRVLGPIHVPVMPLGDSSGDGSVPNNASVVMIVDVDGFRLLLSGDAESEEQGDIVATGADLGVDVLKVAHHGSANQDPAFVSGTTAPLAVISVGADNDYGHPASQTLGLLTQLRAQVYRTDLDGDVAVVERAGQLAVVTGK